MVLLYGSWLNRKVAELGPELGAARALLLRLSRFGWRTCRAPRRDITVPAVRRM
ncbi:hypothetical protein GCM10028783_00990 [Modestobacter muralis]